MTVAQNAGYGPLVQRRDGPTPRRSCRRDARDRRPVGIARPLSLRSSPAARSSASPWPAPSSANRKVILLDEPLAALDATLRRQMQVFLKQIQRRIQTTFIFVTHDQDEAITMSDRIVVMSQGRIEQVGTPKELYFRPRTRFVAGFFGDNNLIEGTMAASGIGRDRPWAALPHRLPASSTPGARSGGDPARSLAPWPRARSPSRPMSRK